MTAPYPLAKVYGERGSGTNLVERLLALNFELRLVGFPQGYSEAQSALMDRTGYPRIGLTELVERVQDAAHATGLARHAGWKHGCLDDRIFGAYRGMGRTLFVCVIRHPALWIASLHRRPFHSFFETPERLADFLRHPWATRPRDGMAEVLLETPVLLWRAKVASYLDAAAARDDVVVLRHEDILRDHAAVLAGLDGPLTPLGGPWRVPEGDARHLQQTGATGGADLATRRDALPADPWKTLDPADAGYIREAIGADLLARAGYDGSGG